MKQIYLKTIAMVLCMVMGGVVAWAQDPDLNDYVILKTLDFSNAYWGDDQTLNKGSVKVGTAFETGNRKQQEVFDVIVPSEFSGYLAVQATNDQDGKGWWLRATKGGLWSYNAERSAQIYNLKEGYIVKFTCTDNASKVITLTNAEGNPDGNFTYVTSSDEKSYYCTMTADGYVGFCGIKSSGYISSITIYVPAGELLAPTAELTKVTEDGKTYTITNPNGRGTLYYTASVVTGEDAPSVGDGAYSSTADATVDVTISESGNLYAYVADGSANSDITTVAVDATKETLNAPVITLSGMAGADEAYFPVVTIAHEAKVGNFTPTVTLSYDLNGTDVTSSVAEGKYTFTSAGTLTVKATADGYVENSASYMVAFPYLKENDINIASITEEDVNTDYWTKNPNETTGEQWNFNEAVNYSLASADYIKTAIEGITLWWDDSLMPKLYIGKGLMWPYGGSNNKDISVTDGNEDQVVVWTYIENYGAKTQTATTTGDKPYSLYRFSWMLQRVEIYSLNIPTESVIIGETGYSTFASTYALDLDNLPEGLKAYYVLTDNAVSENEESVILTPATGVVPAGEGLILAGEANEEYKIPVATEGTPIAGNLLKGYIGKAEEAEEETEEEAEEEIEEVAEEEEAEGEGEEGGEEEEGEEDGEEDVLTLEAAANLYVLVNNDGTAEFQSLAEKGATIPVGKAYLVLPDNTSAGSRLRISFGNEDGGATAIQIVEKAPATDGVYYNLAGQRVLNPAKGIYIVNGQKVLVK